MPYKKKAPAKRTKKAMGGALSAAQKRLLGSAQAGAVKKGAGAITKQMVNYTRKHGDQRKAAAAPAKRKAPTSSAGRVMKQITPAQMRALRARGQTAKPKKGGIAMSKAARSQLMQQQKLVAARKRRGSPTTRRPAVGSTPRTFSRMTPAQLAAARRRAIAAARKRRAPSRRRAPTAAQRRAQMAAARKRAMAAARKRRAPSRRIKRPVRRPSSSRGLSRSALLRARRRRRAEGGLMSVNARRFARAMGKTSTSRQPNPMLARLRGVKKSAYNKSHSIRSTMFSKNFQNSMMNSKEL
mgnify:CR=1 FL=1